MDQQLIQTQPDSDGDALAAFERMGRQLAMLTAAVEGFAARQARIEQRDYTQDLAQLTERHDKVEAAIRTLASRPGVQLTPSSLAEGIAKASVQLRAPEQAALAAARAAMNEASGAMTNVVVAARSRADQRDAIIWAAVIATGVTMLFFIFAPLLIGKLWPAVAEDRAAAILNKSRWDAGIELMSAGDPTRWRQLVDADRFQRETAQAVSACQKRADASKRTVRCPMQIEPTVAASGPRSNR
ncbi:hypothetical protein EAH79_14285 [Sphingomonas koreensis]|nr:hypothetical protein EAH79_14285 [Sphingomonas koreensis]